MDESRSRWGYTLPYTHAVLMDREEDEYLRELVGRWVGVDQMIYWQGQGRPVVKESFLRKNWVEKLINKSNWPKYIIWWKSNSQPKGNQNGINKLKKKSTFYGLQSIKERSTPQFTKYRCIHQGFQSIFQYSNQNFSTLINLSRILIKIPGF